MNLVSRDSRQAKPATILPFEFALFAGGSFGFCKLPSCDTWPPKRPFIHLPRQSDVKSLSRMTLLIVTNGKKMGLREPNF